MKLQEEFREKYLALNEARTNIVRDLKSTIYVLTYVGNILGVYEYEQSKVDPAIEGTDQELRYLIDRVCSLENRMLSIKPQEKVEETHTKANHQTIKD